ncbi:MAG TPA: hydantoinase B/oxoprolinase family protein [Acidimicrobiales bacterium]
MAGTHPAPPAGERAQLLRELDSAEFEARYGCDRFTATMLTNRCRYVAAHMANQVRSHAFSPVIRDGSDLCAMVSGPAELGYAMAAVSETMPLFYGSIPDAVRIVIEEYGADEMDEGDVLIVNDYYRVGTHLNDVCLMQPVFRDGRIVAVATIRAHFLDMGGIAMGGFEVVKKSTWEDGLRIPPTLLVSRGRTVTSVLKLLYDNTRLGSLCVPDLMTEIKALDMGVSLLGETIDRYGVEAFTGAVRYACDVSAEAIGEGLRTVPDGVYEGEDWLDGDGLPDSPEYSVKVRITKVGDRAEIDLRGSSGPTRTAINGAWPDIKTGLAYALKSLLDPTTPVSSGTLRNVDVIVPPSAMFNVGPPLPCQMYFLVVYTMVHATYRALNPVLGERAVATGYVTASASGHGRRPDGLEGSLVDSAGPAVIGAWGATRHGDADSSQQSSLGNLINDGVEIHELRGPIVWAASDYVPDSAGAGRHRGGAAIVHDTLWRVPAAHTMQLLFHARRPTAGGGVNGGGSGPTTTAWIFDASVSDDGARLPELPSTLEGELYRGATPFGGVVHPDTHAVDPDGELVVLEGKLARPAGAVVRVLSAAGGGWGDPWTRDPELVKRDVRDEYVSIEGAARDYGVVVVGDLRHPERLAVDGPATEELRRSSRPSESTGPQPDPPERSVARRG